MRETGIVRFRFLGDTRLATQRLSIARTLLGRTKAYLGQARGAKTWHFDDGTVIRTRFYGEVQIAEIDVRGVIKKPDEPGWYFIYLFGGSQFDGENKAMGWRVNRATCAVQEIPGMPFVISDNPRFADNYKRGGQIVVCCEEAVLVYKAHANSGVLELERRIEIPSPTRFDDFHATQVAGTYVCSYVNDATNYRSYLIVDAVTGDISALEYASEGAAEGNQFPHCYARGTVGRSNHHPTKKLIYRKTYRLEDMGTYTAYYLNLSAVSYVDPTDAGTVVAQWEWRTGASVVTFARSDPVISFDGKFLVASDYQAGNGYLVTMLGDDGVTPLEHKVPASPYPVHIPAATTAAIDFPLGGGDVPRPEPDFSNAPWNGYGPLFDIDNTSANLNSMRARGGALFFEEARLFFPPPETAPGGTQFPGATDIAMQSIQCYRGGAPNRFGNYATNGAEFVRNQYSLALIDGSQVVRSLGQFQTSDDGIHFTYIFQPRLSIQRVKYAGPDVIGFQEKKSIPIASGYNDDQERYLWQLSRLGAMVLFEPVEGIPESQRQLNKLPSYPV